METKRDTWPITLWFGLIVLLIPTFVSLVSNGIMENIVILSICWFLSLLIILYVQETQIDLEGKMIHSRIGFRFWSSRKSLPFDKISGIHVSIMESGGITRYSAQLQVEALDFPSIWIASGEKFGLVAKAAEEASVMFDCPITEDEKIKEMRDDLGEPLV